MSNASDFVIENGVLKKYVGPGGDVVVPDGVTSIGKEAFSWNEKLRSITLRHDSQGRDCKPAASEPP